MVWIRIGFWHRIISLQAPAMKWEEENDRESGVQNQKAEADTTTSTGMVYFCDNKKTVLAIQAMSSGKS
jgi:hypothetical protein